MSLKHRSKGSFSIDEIEALTPGEYGIYLHMVKELSQKGLAENGG